MRAFVTGGSGFIGSRLLEILAQKSWKAKALVHKTPLREDLGIETVFADLSDTAVLIRELEGTDVLFHLAAAVGSAVRDKEAFARVNVEGTRSLFRAAREARVRRIVHFSSAGVIGKVADGEIADEGYPLNPQNAYDITKLGGEEDALRIAREGIETVVVRPGWVYGPGDRRTLKLIRSILRRRFFLVDGGRGRQTPVFVDDLVQGALLAAESGRSGKIYHIAGGEILSVKTMAEIIAAACGTRIPRFSLPAGTASIVAEAADRIFRLLRREAPINPGKLAFFLHSKALSIEKAKRELGYRPETDFKAGMARTVAWYKDRNWL
jgi:dihydroflavonol-4-reductase